MSLRDVYQRPCAISLHGSTPRTILDLVPFAAFVSANVDTARAASALFGAFSHLLNRWRNFGLTIFAFTWFTQVCMLELLFPDVLFFLLPFSPVDTWGGASWCDIWIFVDTL